jgi:conjugal transfer pilus assembly protein TraF
MRPIVVLIMIFCSLASARAESSDKSYYDDSRRGWWWYEDPPATVKDKKEGGKKEAVTARVLPSLKDYTTEELWNMHPDDFQPLIKDFMKKAVQTPTIETVREFYIMLDIARMKSHVFQNVAGAVLQKYPELSLNADIPIDAFGVAAKNRMKQIEVDAKLKESAQDYALIYFHSEDCKFCKAQDEVLDEFIGKYGWEVKRIEISEHPELAARFEVRMTPYVILVYRDSKDFFPVVTGVTTLDEMEDRIFRGVRLLSGETGPESYTMYDFQRGGKQDPSIYMRGSEGIPR